MEHKFDTQAACSACKATGLYRGIAEGDGSAVVCHRCKETGEVTLTLEWDEFRGRQERPGVTRVVATNPGIVIGEGDAAQFRLEDFGGLAYEDWKRGESFGPRSEMRVFTCPAWWYQSADYDKKPRWEECLAAGSFSRCAKFPNKAACWERFDRESEPAS